MYGIIQFEKKECAVVPLSWLTEEQSKCYWPKQVTQKMLDQLVKAQKEPLITWGKYLVVKVHQITDTYDEACNILEKVIMDESNSSDAANEVNAKEILVRKVQIAEYSQKRKLSNQAESAKRRRTDTSSGEEFSSEDGTPQINLQKESFDTTITLDSSTTTLLSTPALSRSALSTLPSTPTLSRSALSTPVSLTPAVPSVPSTSLRSTTSTPLQLQPGQGLDSSLAETVLERLERVIGLQDQNSIKLDNILRYQQQNANNILDRPQNFPILPVKTKTEYKAVEEFLTREENFTYMKRRLASIGGSSVRNTIMNMMKYLLNNQVAMKFNWCGKDKRPFKNTKMCAVVTEATKFCYSNTSDSSDKIIKESIQDWLKMAKSRYIYSLKKQ